MTIGPLGTLTPDEARRKARDILANARLGGDPAAEQLRQRGALTLAQVAQRFLSDEAGRLKRGTLRNYELYFRRHILPQLGSTKIGSVTPADVARLHRTLGRTMPVTANRAVEAIGSLYRYAAREGLVEKGFRPPSADVIAFREKACERFLSMEELSRLGVALEEAETEGIPWTIDKARPTSKHVPKRDQRTQIDPFAAAAIRLLLFTGARLNEILKLRWSYVDSERGLLLLPDSKTGKKAIVLNAPALAILAELPRIGPYVISGRDPELPRSDLKKPWSALTKYAGLQGLRIHDLRHSFASVGASKGMGLPIVGKLLGHTSPTTTNRYAHLDTDPLRQASNRIAMLISAAISNRPPGQNFDIGVEQ
jgi:integrase